MLAGNAKEPDPGSMAHRGRPYAVGPGRLIPDFRHPLAVREAGDWIGRALWWERPSPTPGRVLTPVMPH